MPDLIVKALSEAEQLKLRHLLAQTPAIEPSDMLGSEYPKMLYHEDYLDLWQIVKGHKDPLAVKEARELIRATTVIVTSFEEEEEYLADGWVNTPAELFVRKGLPDPRVATGREGRRADAQNKASRDEELRALKRRFMELTGGARIDSDDAVALAVPEMVAPVVEANGKKQRQKLQTQAAAPRH